MRPEHPLGQRIKIENQRLLRIDKIAEWNFSIEDHSSTDTKHRLIVSKGIGDRRNKHGCGNHSGDKRERPVRSHNRDKKSGDAIVPKGLYQKIDERGMRAFELIFQFFIRNSFDTANLWGFV